MPFPTLGDEFWAKILVDVTRLESKWKEASIRGSLANYLSDLPKDNLGFIGSISGVPIDISQHGQQCALQLATSDSGFTLSCLREFADSKAQSINAYWATKGNATPSGIERIASFTKLVKLFSDNPDSLKEIYVLQYWMGRASGRFYTANTILNFGFPAKSAERLPDLINQRAEGPYRLYGSCPTTDGDIIMLFRQDPEKLLEGYDHHLRYVGAKPVLLQVTRGSSVSILEVKTDLITVQDATVQAVGEVLGASWVDKDDEPFSDYQTDNIQRIIQAGGEDKSLTVTGIELGNVRLKSPGTVLTLQASEDVAESLDQLSEFSPELTMIQSLLDLKRVKVRIPDDDAERWVESRQLSSGAIMFSLDDRKLLPDQVKKVKELFMARFKLPLNQAIDHSKFTIGRARLIDYLFSADYRENIPGYQLKTLDSLCSQELIIEETVTPLECRLCGRRYPDLVEECPRCGSTLRPGAAVKRLQAHPNLEDHIFEMFDSIAGWKAIHKGEMKTIGGEKFRVFRVKPQAPLLVGTDRGTLANMEILVHIMSSLPKSETVKRFQTHPEPIFVVYVGNAALGRQRDRLAHLYGETLGELIAKQETKKLDSVSDSLISALADGGTRMRAAIIQARERVTQAIAQQQPPADYTPGNFEADCWALLRGVFTDTVKWGDDKLKKPLPDGLFYFSYRRGKVGRTVRVWTYDAKLSETGEGYDLAQAEKRKMHEYLSNAAMSRRIEAYTNEEGFTGHLLISNRFNTRDFDPVKEYMFKQNRKLAGQVKVRFMDVDALLYLSLMADSHQAAIQQRYDILLEELDRLLLGDEAHITKPEVEKMLTSVLQQDPERPPLDIKAVEKDFEK